MNEVPEFFILLTLAGSLVFGMRLTASLIPEVGTDVFEHWQRHRGGSIDAGSSEPVPHGERRRGSFDVGWSGCR